MKTAKWIAFGIAIFSGIVCLMAYAGMYILIKIFSDGVPGAGSIGIIGGEDGPTAIFILTKMAPWLMIPLHMARMISPVVFVLAVVSWLFFRFKSKKQQSQ